MNRLLLIAIAILLACCGCKQKRDTSNEEQKHYAERQQQAYERDEALRRQWKEEEECKASQRLWFRDNSPPLKRYEIIWTIRDVMSIEIDENSGGPFWFIAVKDGVYRVISGSGRHYQLEDGDIDWESRHEELMEKNAHE